MRRSSPIWGSMHNPRQSGGQQPAARLTHGWRQWGERWRWQWWLHARSWARGREGPLLRLLCCLESASLALAPPDGSLHLRRGAATLPGRAQVQWAPNTRAARLQHLWEHPAGGQSLPVMLQPVLKCSLGRAALLVPSWGQRWQQWWSWQWAAMLRCLRPHPTRGRPLQVMLCCSWRQPVLPVPA